MNLLAQMTKQEWWVLGVAGAVVLVVAILGWQDLLRFSFRRVRAIAGVCFREAIRRRVLWVTPLAIIAVIAVAQLTRPYDEEDAIRQTTRYCLFISGIIVVITAILLACTNLPKEIENRVIFTIVTKPTTRLEIVLGKVLGFATVSGAMLLIMGAFTFAYLELRTWAMQSNLKAELAGLEHQEAEKATPATGPSSQPTTLDATEAEAHASATLDRQFRTRTLRRYLSGGLLGTKDVQWPTNLEVMARDPGVGAAGVRWIVGGPQMFLSAPMILTASDRAAIEEALKQGRPAYLVVTLAVDRQAHPSLDQVRELEQGHAPLESDLVGVRGKDDPVVYRPQISLSIHSPKTGKFLAADVLQNKKRADQAIDPQPDPKWKPPATRQYRISLGIVDGRVIKFDPLNELLEEGSFNIDITGLTVTYDFGAGATPVSLVVPGAGPGDGDFTKPLFSISNSVTESVESAAAVVGSDETLPKTPPGVRAYTHFGRTGMQLAGQPPQEGDGMVAVYRFSGGDNLDAPNGQVVVQTKLAVERAGDFPVGQPGISEATISVRNLKTGFLFAAPPFQPQTNHVVDISVPVAAVEGGEFDVLVRGRTPGQVLSLHGLTASLPSITVITAEHSFLVNLFKSLLVLWMLSVLVVAISVFCSTFLSWPIAVVLALLFLLGRWGVEALGESLDAGASRGIVQDLFRMRDPSQTRAVTDSIEALSTVLRTVGPVLPSIDRFPVFEDIDHGLNMPMSKVFRALRELLVYGVPLTMLTYLILRNKEVAP